MVVMTMKMTTSENKYSSHWCTIRGWIGHSNYKKKLQITKMLTKKLHKWILTHCSDINVCRSLPKVEILICQLTSCLPSLQVGVSTPVNNNSLHLCRLQKVWQTKVNRGQPIAKQSQSNALFTKVAQHSYQENAA